MSGAFDEWVQFSPGVKMRQRTWTEEYVGSADALAAAGLLRVEHLPGMPGMRKMRVTVFPDGTVADGPPTANHPASRKHRARTIERAGKSAYRVIVRNARMCPWGLKEALAKAARDASFQATLARMVAAATA